MSFSDKKGTGHVCVYDASASRTNILKKSKVEIARGWVFYCSNDMENWSDSTR
jgi:phage pi2 protein 07